MSETDGICGMNCCGITPCACAESLASRAPAPAAGEVERLQEALRPFAAHAPDFDDIPGVRKWRDDGKPWRDGAYRCDITVGDLRRARAALSPAAAPAQAGGVLEQVADAIDAARYAHPTNPRERDRPFSRADKSDREYALRLARAAIRATPAATPGSGVDGDGWQPIETAPKDGTRILAHTPSSARPVQEVWWARDYEEQDGYWQTPPGPAGRGYTVLPEGVEAWRPLPSPPLAVPPAQAGGETLDKLLDGVTEENLHPEIGASTPGSVEDGDGWQMVPKEPTPEMIVAARSIPATPLWDQSTLYLWQAMLAASPKTQA